MPRGRPKLTPEEKALRALKRKEAKHTSESGAVKPPERVPTQKEIVADGLAKYEEEWKRQAAVPQSYIESPENQTQELNILKLVSPFEYKIDDSTDINAPDFIAKSREGWVPIE